MINRALYSHGGQRPAPYKYLTPVLLVGVSLCLEPADVLASNDNFRLSNMATADQDWDISVPEHQQYLFDSFMRDLGSIISYKYTFPASTTGLYGFDVGLDVVLAPVNTDPVCPEDIDSGACTDDNRNKWSPWAVIDTDHRLTLGKLYPVPGLRVRKGLPWSVELGTGIYALPFSSQAVLQGFGRWAINEGFDRGYPRIAPDINLTLAGSRLVGNPEFDLGVFDWGMTFGYQFPIGGVARSHTGDFAFWGGFGRSVMTAVPDMQLPDTLSCLQGRTGRLGDQVGDASACGITDPVTGDESRAVIYDESFAPWKGSFGLRVYSNPFELTLSGELVQLGVNTVTLRGGFYF